jgi:hypothetical protein
VRGAVAVAGALVLVAPVAQGAASLPNHRIVLDRSIGGIAVRERRTTVEATLGPGRRSGAHRSYLRGKLEVWYTGRPARVFALRTRSATFETRGGIGVGSSYTEVAAIHGTTCYAGSDCQHGFARLNSPGTGFHFDAPRGHVTWIGIGYGH